MGQWVKNKTKQRGVFIQLFFTVFILTLPVTLKKKYRHEKTKQKQSMLITCALCSNSSGPGFTDRA